MNPGTQIIELVVTYPATVATTSNPTNPARTSRSVVSKAVSYTHLTLPTILRV